MVMILVKALLKKPKHVLPVLTIGKRGQGDQNNTPVSEVYIWDSFTGK